MEFGSLSDLNELDECVQITSKLGRPRMDDSKVAKKTC